MTELMSSPFRALPLRNPVVHLELRAHDVARAAVFYERLFDWTAEIVHAGEASYVILGRGNPVEVGIVADEPDGSLWLPYVEVADVHGATERACLLGATVRLGPVEGPFGWRSVIAAPLGAEIGLWQPKRLHRS